MFTYDEAYAAYREANPFTRIVNGEVETGNCDSICNHKQLKRIFLNSTTIAEVVRHMKSCVGGAGNAVPSLD